jgi:hypothetical protein
VLEALLIIVLVPLALVVAFSLGATLFWFAMLPLIKLVGVVAGIGIALRRRLSS